MAGTIRVVRPGFLTTIQDLGRWGSQAMGVPVAGPMDIAAHRRANRLVGNADAAATLEATVEGPTLHFDRDAVAAVTGGRFDVDIDGLAVPMDAPFRVPAGARLSIGYRRAGARAYVGLDGGIDTPLLLGSRATHLLSAMGGLEGRALRRGDVLPLGAARTDTARRGGVEGRPIDGGARLRVLWGPDDDRFSSAMRETFLAARYLIRSESNRMGYRLEGPPLSTMTPSTLLSEGTPVGSVQVIPSGEPILLMADRQTTGGYPRIATVISADVSLAGQLLPGDWIEFHACSEAEALRALIAEERTLLRLEGS